MGMSFNKSSFVSIATYISWFSAFQKTMEESSGRSGNYTEEKEKEMAKVVKT